MPTVRISDDGAIVAFFREGELWAVNSDGTGERLLVGNDDLAAMERRSDYQDAAVAFQLFDWVPGTHLIAFNTRIQVRIQVPVLNDDLYVTPPLRSAAMPASECLDLVADVSTSTG